MKFCLTFKLSLLFLIGIFSSPVYAEEGKDAALVIQYAIADYEDDLASGIDPTAIVFRFVPKTDNLIGYEGRLGLGLSKGSDTIDSVFGRGEIEVDLHTVIGFYLNARTSIGELATVYGLIGYTWVRYDLKFDDTLLLDAEDETGLSGGFGIDLGKQGGMRLNLEYMQYLDKDDFDISVVSLGVLF